MEGKFNSKIQVKSRFSELSGLTDSVTDTGTVTSSEVVLPTNPSTCVMRMNRPTSLCPRLGLSWSDGSSEGHQIVGSVCALVFEKLYSNSFTIHLLAYFYYHGLYHMIPSLSRVSGYHVHAYFLSQRETSSMINWLSSSVPAPPPAKWPQMLSMTRSSPCFRCFTSSSLSSGGK